MLTITQARASRAAAALRTALVGLLLVGTAAPAAAQQQPSELPRTIRVTGLGEVQAVPDIAHIDLAVETFAQTARAAGEQNARQMDRVIQALVRAGVPRADVQTRGYSLHPEYAHEQPQPRGEPVPREPRIIGYRANNTVSVRTHDLARVGPLIDAALGAGANRMHSLRFGLRDPEAAQNEAVRRAAERARRSAEAIAAALGVRLGQIVDASTATGYLPPPIPMHARMEAMDAPPPPTPVLPGEQTVTATVSVAFAILDGTG